MKIREGAIASWYAFIDWDNPRSRKKKQAIDAKRIQGKKRRLVRDLERQVLAQKFQQQREVRNQHHLTESQKPAVSAQRCRHCGGAMVISSRSPQSGVGCLILLVGLILSPVLIGIPIIIAGLVFMSKTENLWKCSRCGAIG